MGLPGWVSKRAAPSLVVSHYGRHSMATTYCISLRLVMEPTNQIAIQSVVIGYANRQGCPVHVSPNIDILLLWYGASWGQFSTQSEISMVHTGKDNISVWRIEEPV